MNDHALPAAEFAPVDAEIERLVAALPLRSPSDRLDARIAATAHFESRPRISRMQWPAAAAALFLVGAGLAMGWSLRAAGESAWVSLGTQWQSAGLVDLGPRSLTDGRIVRPAGAMYVRTDRLRDPATGATVEITSVTPRIVIVVPQAD